MKQTPIQKAKLLVDKFINIKFCKDFGGMDNDLAKQCAIICLDEKINYHNSLFEAGLKDVHQTMNTPKEIYNDVMNPKLNELKQIKEFIETKL